MVSKKEKLVVDSVDKAIKSYMDENCSPEDYKKLVNELEDSLEKAVRQKKLSEEEFENTNKILNEFENRKNNSDQ
jgi:putative ribosome biogenesis GTPase RsgA